MPRLRFVPSKLGFEDGTARKSNEINLHTLESFTRERLRQISSDATAATTFLNTLLSYSVSLQRCDLLIRDTIIGNSATTSAALDEVRKRHSGTIIQWLKETACAAPLQKGRSVQQIINCTMLLKEIAGSDEQILNALLNLVVETLHNHIMRVDISDASNSWREFDCAHALCDLLENNIESSLGCVNNEMRKRLRELYFFLMKAVQMPTVIVGAASLLSRISSLCGKCEALTIDDVVEDQASHLANHV